MLKLKALSAKRKASTKQKKNDISKKFSSSSNG